MARPLPLSVRRGKAWSSDDFAKALDVLSRDLCSAGDHFTLWKELNKARRSKAFMLAFNQSNTFWHLTFRAHLENTIFRLCRVYDQNLDGLTLRTLLLRLRDWPREQLPTPFDERYEDYHKSVPRDLRYVELQSNPVVKRLMMWRHKEFAHRDVEFAFAQNLNELYPIRFTEIQRLLDRGHAIVSRYYRAFFGTHFMARISGSDDFKSTLKFVDAEIQHRDDELNRQIVEAGGTQLKRRGSRAKSPVRPRARRARRAQDNKGDR